jgi:hypothetical protein
MRYGEELDETIWALAGKDIGPTEIFRIIRAGEGGLPPSAISQRQFWARWSRLKRDRGDPAAAIQTEEDRHRVADAIGDRVLELCERQTQELIRKEKSGKPLTQADIGKARALAKTAQELADPDRPGRETQSAKSQHARAAKQGGEAAIKAPSQLAQKIARQLSANPLSVDQASATEGQATEQAEQAERTRTAGQRSAEQDSAEHEEGNSSSAMRTGTAPAPA